MGWAEITHPFHPLRGQRFKVLKIRKRAGVETLSLRGSLGGTHAVAREWTDRADPLPYSVLGMDPPILDYACLLTLVELVEQLRSAHGEVDK